MFNNLYNLIKAQETASFYNSIPKSDFLTESLFPNEKQFGLELSWIKGKGGMPVLLKPSALDAAAIPRPRIGIQNIITDMPLFRESVYVDEKLMMKALTVLSSNESYLRSQIDTVTKKIFQDEMLLVKAAAARREQMRCMLLTTGVITVSGNGMDYSYDYGMPITNKVTVSTSWSDPTADIAGDIETGKNYIQATTGNVVRNALCDSVTWSNLRKSDALRNAFASRSIGGVISDDMVHSYFLDVFGLNVVISSGLYKNPDGSTSRYVPANTFVMFPSGALGNTWFGTTPDEISLIGGGQADVAIVDSGCAITSYCKINPAQIETVVSQICLPSFEMCDSVYVLTTSV